MTVYTGSKVSLYTTSCGIWNTEKICYLSRWSRNYNSTIAVTNFFGACVEPDGNSLTMCHTFRCYITQYDRLPLVKAGLGFQHGEEPGYALRSCKATEHHKNEWFAQYYSWSMGTGNGTAGKAMAGFFFSLPSYLTWSCNSSLVDLAVISCGYEKCTCKHPSWKYTALLSEAEAWRDCFWLFTMSKSLASCEAWLFST